MREELVAAVLSSTIRLARTGLTPLAIKRAVHNNQIGVSYEHFHDTHVYRVMHRLESRDLWKTLACRTCAGGISCRGGHPPRIQGGDSGASLRRAGRTDTVWVHRNRA